LHLLDAMVTLNNQFVNISYMN